MIDHLPIITLITENPPFDLHCISLLENLMFQVETIIPDMLEHAKYNNCGYALHDTLSNIFASENEWMMQEHGRPMWAEPQQQIIIETVMELGNQMVKWLVANPPYHRLLTADVYETETVCLSGGCCRYWNFQDDYNTLSMMYSVRHDYPQLYWQQQYWNVYGDQIPAWVTHPIDPRTTQYPTASHP